jgi:small GTP-binding protein
MLASGGRDGFVRLWDMEMGRLRRVLEGHLTSVLSVVWSPSGQILASGGRDQAIRLWDAETGRLRHILKGHSNWAYSIAWSPDGETLAAGSGDGLIRLWDAETGRLRHVLKGHSNAVYSIAWSPDGETLASGGHDKVIRLWDIETGHLRRALEGNSNWVYSVVWSPDGQILATCNSSQTIQLWDAMTERLKMVLEGHTSLVHSVAFSWNGNLLASKSVDGTIRLWRCHTGENLVVFSEPRASTDDASYLLRGLAFHPTLSAVAIPGEKETVINIWDLDFDGLPDPPKAAPSISYTNAKVVLVGETGVGKTGLGIRLTEGVWRPTPGSTHGMNVWTLHSEPEREVMLWDLAGQDEYRLVHQLFLNETNVALMLYDPTKSQDTFFGIDYWEKALKNTVLNEMVKFLVAARVDVGSVRLTESDIEAYCKEHGYLAHFATSAETNEGCDELRAAIMSSIPWEQLPRTSSPEVFKGIKDFLATVRQGNRILVREADLRAELEGWAGAEDLPTEDQFRTVIGHVETAGFIKRLSFGDFILLKPELLNCYASDIVDAVRRHVEGLGAVRKADVLNGRIRLKDEYGLKASDKIFLLHATVELFLRLGLALEQDGNLVFPSKFNRRMPPLMEDPVVEVEFDFEGPVENLYTTLIVKFYYGGIFRLKKLWKNAAEFLDGRERVCGVQLHNEGDGSGILKVFFADGIGDDGKALFLKIIADHFKEKSVRARRKRIYRCLHCREVVRDQHAVDKSLSRGAQEMPCLYCFKTFPLFDALEVLYRDDKKFLTQIAAMESRAEARIERGGELISASAELRTGNFKEWARGATIATVAIVFTDVVNSTELNIEFGDEQWRHVCEAHFAQARELIQRGHGYLIKTIGDSVMAAFHSASVALDFALDLHCWTGHESIRIRAGIHIGPVEITSGDAFGQQVSMAARVEAKAENGGIWVSAQVKEDIDILRASKHSSLKWVEHTDVELKGFPQKCTLWSVE